MEFIVIIINFNIYENKTKQNYNRDKRKYIA